MRRLVVFNNISVDGYFTDANDTMDFAKSAPDPEFEAFAARNAAGDGILLFGRVTYEMMAAFWPTRAAEASLPAVAAGMNRRSKIVFSKTLPAAAWQNTTLVREDAVSHVRALKASAGPDLVVLGSGRIVAQLAQAHLVDEFQLVIHPVALGAGRRLFELLREPLAVVADAQLCQRQAFRHLRWSAACASRSSRSSGLTAKPRKRSTFTFRCSPIPGSSA